MRLAFFIDDVFWRDCGVLSTDESYSLFPASLVEAVDEIVFIGREAPEPGRAPYVLDHPAITFHPIPYYPNLYQLWRSNPLIYAQVRKMVRQHARSWDAILISGPHPLGQMVARQCVAFGVPVVLIVRQNLVQQMSAHHGLKRRAAVAAAQALEWDFKRLARGRTVLTAGMEMAEEYRRFSDRVHTYFSSTIDEAQFHLFSTMPAAADPRRLLCVARLSPEKGHQHLFEALVLLKARGIACHLDIVGKGWMERELKARVATLDLSAQVTFHGYVPFGPALYDLYQQAGTSVLPSLPGEGFPRVINEALCIGLPMVATTVGGIPSFLADGETALLVAPGDVIALAGAIERVVRDGDLRERLRRNGRALMSDNTFEANRARVMKILHDEVLIA